MGNEHEVSFGNVLTNEGIGHVHLTNVLDPGKIKIAKIINQEWGDHLTKNFTIDVKRGRASGEVFLSLSSIKNFRGDYFALCPGGNFDRDKVWMWPKNSAQKYLESCEKDSTWKAIEGPSGSLGILVIPPMIRGMSFNDLIKQLKENL